MSTFKICHRSATFGRFLMIFETKMQMLGCCKTRWVHGDLSNFPASKAGSASRRGCTSRLCSSRLLSSLETSRLQGCPLLLHRGEKQIDIVTSPPCERPDETDSMLSGFCAESEKCRCIIRNVASQQMQALVLRAHPNPQGFVLEVVGGVAVAGWQGGKQEMRSAILEFR